MCAFIYKLARSKLIFWLTHHANVTIGLETENSLILVPKFTNYDLLFQKRKNINSMYIKKNYCIILKTILAHSEQIVSEWRYWVCPIFQGWWVFDWVYSSNTRSATTNQFKWPSKANISKWCITLLKLGAGSSAIDFTLLGHRKCFGSK